MDWLTDLFGTAQQALFEAVVQPLLFNLGLGNFLEDGFVGTGWLLVGLIQLAVLVLVIGPLQRWRPVDALTDRHAVRIDVLYTLIHRLGLLRVALFFTLDPWFDDLFGMARVAGWTTFHLDALWPGVTDVPWISFALYLVVFDFVDYWIHRGQHQFNWWWALHSVHHSQRQMTMWSDNRNHLLDDVLRDCIMVVVAQLIGIAPGQFIAVVAFTQLSENFQHANLRLWFGAIGERLWVSPRFHRLHHAIGIGHESPIKPRAVNVQPGARAPLGGSEDTSVQGVGAVSLSAAGPSQGARAPLGGSEDTNVPSVGAVRLGGHNFGVLLPWWDMLFGTANFEQRYDPTGIRDQVEPGPDGRLRNYGEGFWAQQWLGLRRMVGRG